MPSEVHDDDVDPHDSLSIIRSTRDAFFADIQVAVKLLDVDPDRCPHCFGKRVPGSKPVHRKACPAKVFIDKYKPKEPSDVDDH